LQLQELLFYQPYYHPVRKGQTAEFRLRTLVWAPEELQPQKVIFCPVPDSRSVATCDAFTNRREDLAKEISAYYKEKYQEEITCTPYLDFHEILERPDIDAVHISTGDHWHLPIAIKAANAGKHIYLEKPLGLNFDQMIELEKIIKKKNLIFQYGTQQRSLVHVKKGIEMIKAGEIGEITKIDIWAPSRC
jgi:glucose-fructose oxidoreductase